VALATCAFEAYAEVETKGVTEKTVGETQIVFTDPGFLQEKMEGLMKVTLHRAVGLPADAGGDVVCTVTLGDDCFTTNAGKVGGGEVTWEGAVGGDGESRSVPDGGGSGTLFVRDAQRQRLSIKLLASTKGGDPVGTALRGVADLVEGRHVELAELGLKGGAGGDGGGKVYASFHFVPFSDPVLADEASASEMGGVLLSTMGRGLMPDSWRELEAKLLAAELPPFTPIAFVENEASNTQVWLFWNRQLRQLVVAFRGTEQTKWRGEPTVLPGREKPDVLGQTTRLACLLTAPSPCCRSHRCRCAHRHFHVARQPLHGKGPPQSAAGRPRGAFLPALASFKGAGHRGAGQARGGGEKAGGAARRRRGGPRQWRGRGRGRRRRQGRGGNRGGCGDGHRLRGARGAGQSEVGN
jgi:hypothetical protein